MASQQSLEFDLASSCVHLANSDRFLPAFSLHEMGGICIGPCKTARTALGLVEEGRLGCWRQFSPEWGLHVRILCISIGKVCNMCEIMIGR